MEYIRVCETHKDVAMQPMTSEKEIQISKITYDIEMSRVEFSNFIASERSRNFRKERPELVSNMISAYAGWIFFIGSIERNGQYYCPVCGDELHRLVEKYQCAVLAYMLDKEDTPPSLSEGS